MLFKKKKEETIITSVEDVDLFDDNDIQTTFNTDDIDELGGVVVEGSEPELDDSPDVDMEEE